MSFEVINDVVQIMHAAKIAFGNVCKKIWINSSDTDENDDDDDRKKL